ncbi:Hypothetical protein CINCED_3A010102 [Cinara cedri]|uniref:Uncharacterized protein n=1 Tax=Cinara cedri TaxID=506608 RepID=A0A5E4N081_9HEMI|nr:Hypothetical protein CINCED_3A010102 [Cinara cedri]
MKPSLPTRHLNTKHSDSKNKNIIFFKRLLENKNKCYMRTYFSTGSANEDAVEASFRISYRITRSGKNHTIGENLILPSIKDAVSLQEKEKLLELKTNFSLETAFQKKSIIIFWVDVKEEYPELSCKACNVLLPFTSTMMV